MLTGSGCAGSLGSCSIAVAARLEQALDATARRPRIGTMKRHEVPTPTSLPAVTNAARWVLVAAAAALLAAEGVSAQGGDSLPKGFAPWQESEVPLTKEYPVFRVAKAEGRVLGTLENHMGVHDVPVAAPVMHILDPDESSPEKVRIAATALFYPDTTVGDPGDHGEVVVEDWEPHTVLSIAFTGRGDLPALRSRIEELEPRFLGRDREYVRVGPYRVMSYDGPAVPEARRRHELQAPVMTPDAWREYSLARTSRPSGSASADVENALQSLAGIAEEWGEAGRQVAYRRILTNAGVVYRSPEEVAVAFREGGVGDLKRALSIVARLGDPRAFVPLACLLEEHPAWMVRGTAALQLGMMRDPRAFPVLVDALGKQGDSDDATRDYTASQIALGLAYLGDERAVTPIRRSAAWFRDHHKPPRSTRIRTLDGTYVRLTWVAFKAALALLGETEFLPTIRMAARDNSMSPAGGISMLLKLQDEQAFDILVEQLGSESWGIRRVAVKGLGELGDERARPHLEGLRNDDREEVRAAVERALEELE